jgi:2-dehydro-3-deoxyphosphooctonate aldolase (KDO 8-P synthase)
MAQHTSTSGPAHAPLPGQCRVGGLDVGHGRPLAIIAGPCVLESYELGLTIGTALRDACSALGLSYIFKASFDKANRSSIHSARGPGLDQGLDWIARLRDALGVPVTTDIHEPAHAGPAARCVDLLQIPAFLCRQTDLLLAAGEAAAKHDRAVNGKKGQFMAPAEMANVVTKLHEAGTTNVLLTERGTFFGYGRLVNDFIGLGDLMALRVKGRDTAPPVCFDVTHSTQQPGLGTGATGSVGEATGGRPDRAPLLARAAAAAGVHALFIECHPDPRSALSDGATMLTMPVALDVLKQAAAIRRALA